MITKLLIPGALIVAAIALFFSLTQPAMDQMALRQVAKAEAVEARDTAKEVQRIQQKLKAQKQAIDPVKLERLDKLLPNNTPDNVQLIIDLNNIALKHGPGMALRNIKMRTDDGTEGGNIGPNAKPYGTVTLSFTVTGPYSALKDFLNDLETSLRLIDVTSLSFAAADKDSYEYNFEIKTYWLK